MGSILIRHVPNGVHRKFKAACRNRKVSMEQAIVDLLERSVSSRRRGRPAKAAKRARSTKRTSATKRPASARRRRRPARGRSGRSPRTRSVALRSRRRGRS